MSNSTCFHCGEPLPPGETRSVTVDGQDRPVCCAGCEAVAKLIQGSGLQDFYTYRTAPSSRPDTPLEAVSDEWNVFDRKQAQRDFVRSIGENGPREAALLLDGLTCAACGWLIEHLLAREDGVLEIQVNPTSGRARLRWDPSRIPLSALLRRLAALGYRPHPLNGSAAESAFLAERRRAIRRLAVAGVGMMQVMMYAVALYAGAFQGMDPTMATFLRGVSLLVATPVVLYSAQPFFAGALRDLRSARAGMDVPVALAIGSAFLASVWHTLRGSGDVYFDSATMFTFFLSVGRFVEMAARHKAAEATDALLRMAPESAIRMVGSEEERVAVNEINPGDILSVPPATAVPVDGSVIAGESRVDESLLTGESIPVKRGIGDRVAAGSLNLTASLTVRADAVAQETLLANIGRLLEQAQSDRPRLARLADRAAGRFVLTLLLVAAAVGGWWLYHAPGSAFSVVLAVLVVTCPCALSLATPAALVAATGQLARRGLLVTRGHALETLAKADRIVFDKTGTLTDGSPSIATTRCLGEQSENDCMALAAALESQSRHPVAHAFLGQPTPYVATDAAETPGLGIEGFIGGRRYRIGSANFAAALSGAAIPALVPESAGTQIALGNETGLLALFELTDQSRRGTAEALRQLDELGLTSEIASGDAPVTVAALARQLAIPRWQARLTPDAKLNHIRALQRSGSIVAMVGDGVNDAPVLAGADVSVAIASGAALARSSAAMILLGESIAPLTAGVRLCRRTMAVIKQNLIWAVVYNFVAIPVAAAGIVSPWMAAIGMSASSLFVVLNALRLTRADRTAAVCPVELPLTPTPQGGTP